jgi:hypothetical protein
MSKFTIPYIIFLVILCLLLFLPRLLNKKVKLRYRLLSYLGIFLILGIVSYLMNVRKIYQCALEVPDQIRISGNINDHSHFYLNNYLILLYRDNIQIKSYVAVNDKFNIDNPHNANFELIIPNEDRVTRCSMRMDFGQMSSGRNYLLFNNKTTYLLQNLTGIQSDANLTLNIDDRKKKYILKVLPSSQDTLQREISLYSTYLDQSGKVRVNVPIKTFSMQGNLPVEIATNYVVLQNLSLTPSPSETNPNGFDVRSAWVSNPTYETSGAIIMDNSSINVNNCRGSSRIKQPVTAALAFMREVEFQTEVLPNYNLENYDLAMVALKASQSLGFTQGEIDTQEAIVDVDVPPGAYIIYKPIWQEVWEGGELEIDSGPEIIKLPFRASNVIYKYPEIHYAACP